VDSLRATLKILLGRDDGGITPVSSGGEVRVEMEPE